MVDDAISYIDFQSLYSALISIVITLFSVSGVWKQKEDHGVEVVKALNDAYAANLKA